MMTTAIPSIPRTLGGRLHYYRENAGLSREQAAIHIGRAAVTVRDWELGRRPPRYVFLVQLSQLEAYRKLSLKKCSERIALKAVR
jgi:transcriptional regulator with XRE-family HTH domain